MRGAVPDAAGGREARSSSLPTSEAATRGEATVRSLLIFRCGSVWFGLDARMVDEVVEDSSATPLPLAPVHVPGILVVRGKAVPLLSLETFLGVAEAAESGNEDERGESDEAFRRVVVLQAAGMQVGIRSNRVRGVVDVPTGDLAAPDALLAGRLPEFSEAQIGQDDGLAAVLAIEPLLEAARVRG